MRPVSITLERFGSFRSRQTFTFPEGPGLYFLSGQNDLEPRLGSNGAGKSTLWKALTWVLYGKDTRGLKAGDVANWDEPKGAYVGFRFATERTEYLVERTHSPNKWTILDRVGDVFDLAKDEANPLTAMLGLTFEQWLTCVLTGQGEPMFLDRSAAQKSEMFTTLLGLEKWDRYSTRASDLTREVTNKATDDDRLVAKLEGEEQALVRAAEPSPYDWAGQHKRNLAEVSRAYELAMEARDRAENAYLRLGEKAADRRASIPPVPHALIDAERKLGELMIDARMIHAAKTAEAKRLAEQDEQLEGATECPLCGDRHGVQEAAERTREALLTADAKDKAAATEARRVAEEWDEVKRRLRKAEEARRDAIKAADDAEAEHRAAKLAVDRCEQILDELERRSDAIEAETNPHAEVAERAARELADVRARLAAARIEARTSATRAEMLGFWVRGFKDLRLRLSSDALYELAIEANASLQALGLVEWELVFEAEKETKAGTLKSGFNVYVKSPAADRQVPFEAWSGGEAQRLRVAAQMGLGDLMRSKLGIDLPLEVWDEPTEGMSDAGVADLLDALRERAVREGRQVWVVDHRSLHYADWSGEFTVVKDNNGSRFA